jgi:hypothetical protein
MSDSRLIRKRIVIFGWIINFVLLFLLVGCSDYEIDLNNKKSNIEELSSNLTRFIDEEAGVVCWERNPGGISCLPIKDTLLEEK